MDAFPALPGMPRLPGLPSLAKAPAPDHPDQPPAWTARPHCVERTRGERARTVHIESTGQEHERRRFEQVKRSIVKHRSADRSEHSRREAVAERPQNIRAARILELSYATGGHHNRRLIPEARSDENQIANRSYRGSHRAGSMHHADDQTAEQQRNSRVGRHHAEPTDDLSGRW
ncbi:hypothetical protein [Paractinoplanes rishiriensis]|nr:hypothetical protein [Actinoplanes rishiriensis]